MERKLGFVRLLLERKRYDSRWQWKVGVDGVVLDSIDSEVKAFLRG